MKIFISALIGALLGVLVAGVVIALNIHGGLATGIDSVDSILYSMPGIMAPVLAAVAWSFCGGAIGLIVGCMLAARSRSDAA